MLSTVPGATDFYKRELNRGPEDYVSAWMRKINSEIIANQHRIRGRTYADIRELHCTAAVAGQWGFASGLVDRGMEEANR
jgi:polyribonucleotide nucleotidyltransferase